MLDVGESGNVEATVLARKTPDELHDPRHRLLSRSTKMQKGPVYAFVEGLQGMLGGGRQGCPSEIYWLRVDTGLQEWKPEDGTYLLGGLQQFHVSADHLHGNNALMLLSAESCPQRFEAVDGGSGAGKVVRCLLV